jgi:formamidopyrimidine-DNA glycosylase
MPELPEVEFARRQLERWLVGGVIQRVTISDARVVEQPRTISRILGQRVHAVERRGKRLRIALDDGYLFSHLGMTGKWVSGDEAPRFERVRLEVKQGKGTGVVRYVDPRLFGRMRYAKEDTAAWRALGPDPLHDGVYADRLYQRLQRRSGAVKPALLDQKLLAGVGNIQAIEALFLAAIDPRRRAHALSRKEVGVLARSIKKTIDRTLRSQLGDTITYVEEPGSDNPFLIYGRAGDRGGSPCPRCKTTLKKFEQAGRGTVYCPRCQR